MAHQNQGHECTCPGNAWASPRKHARSPERLLRQRPDSAQAAP